MFHLMDRVPGHGEYDDTFYARKIVIVLISKMSFIPDGS